MTDNKGLSAAALILAAGHSGGGGGSEPAAYLKSAAVDSNTLTLTNKDNTTVTFTPTTDLSAYRTSAAQDVIDAGKQATLTAGSNISISGNTISATDTTYTAGNAIGITNNEIGLKYSNGLQVNPENMLEVNSNALAGMGLSVNNRNRLINDAMSVNCDPMYIWGSESEPKTCGSQETISINYESFPLNSHNLMFYVLYFANNQWTQEATHIEFETRGENNIYIADWYNNPDLGNLLIKKLVFNQDNNTAQAMINFSHPQYYPERQYYFEIWEEQAMVNSGLILRDGTLKLVTGEPFNPPILSVKNPVPNAPASDGNYVLKCTVASGAATFNWVAE